ncbi:MAG: hypothetical protein Q7R44_00445 [bacterium]|nr:hypothetical protein [bacterium]
MKESGHMLGMQAVLAPKESDGHLRKNLEITVHRSHDVVVPDGRIIKTELLFATRSGDLWLLMHNGDINFKSNSCPEVRPEILSELAGRQRFVSAMNAKTATHDEVGRFLATNWNRLSQTLTGLTSDSLPCFREVELDTDGRIDFLGFAPDNRVFIFEVCGRSRTKIVQSEKHLKGLKKILPESISIIPVVAKYSLINHVQLVELRSGIKT